MKLSVLLFILLSSTLLLCPAQSRAQLPLYDEAGRTYNSGRWQFDVQTTYYQATANYSSAGGEYTTLPSGYSYSLLDIDFGTRWAPKDLWAVYVSSRVSNAESKDTIDTRTNSTLTRAVIGTDFRLYGGKSFELYPDLSLTIPFKRVEKNGDEVLNDEGTMEVSGKIIGRSNWGMLDPFAFVGFTYRDDDRSSLVPFGAGAELQFTRWRLGAELRGYQTVINDKYSNNTYQREIVSKRNGNSLRYYSVDPSLLETNVWLRGQLTQAWAMKIGGGTSVTGANTSAGWTAFAGLSFAPEFKSSPSSAPAPTQQIQSPLQPADDTQRFEEETSDGVDQNLFRKPEPPPPPPPPTPSHDQQRKKLQNELNQTEFQIELKSTKKKKKKR